MIPERLETLADVERLLATSTNYEQKLPLDDLERAFDLARMRALLASLGHPELGPATIHVTGSKGKGSTCRMVASILAAAGGGPVGLYVSPHLESLVERVSVDDLPAEGPDLARAASALLPWLRAHEGTALFPTFFELLTATAHVAFRAARVRSVVLEVGLGGRLDATTVCAPAVTAITSIELEHVKLLGDTLAKIAREKAGILKSGVPCVTAVPLGGEALASIEEEAARVGAPLHVLGRDFFVEGLATGRGPSVRTRVRGPCGAPALDVRLPVAGRHQATNAAVAVAIARTLGLAEAAIVDGLARVTLPGRMERVLARPTVVIDGAHTAASGAAALATARDCFPHARLHLVIGVLGEKDGEGVLGPLLAAAASVTCSPVPSPRALPSERLASLARRLTSCPVEVATDPAAALDGAITRADPDDLVLVTGSTYLAGAARTAARAHPGFLGGPPPPA